jgi:glycerophosphoryl diester phosphodiesterase
MESSAPARRPPIPRAAASNPKHVTASTLDRDPVQFAVRQLDSDFLSLTPPRAIAHRGSGGTHPENTMVSFQAAFDADARYFELDVHLTRDGEIVVSHDEDLARACGRDGRICELSFAEVAGADAGYTFSLDGGRTHPFRGRGIRIPRLADVFDSFPTTRFVIEIKQTAPSLVAPLLDVIERAGMRRTVLVASEHHAPLEELRALAPGIPTNFSSREVAGLLQAMAAKDDGYVAPAAALQIPVEYESWRLVTPETIAFAHRHGVEVHVWTVNDEAEMRELLALGVDGLISDYPARLLAVMGSLLR